MLPKARDWVIGWQLSAATRKSTSWRVMDFLELDPTADLDMPSMLASN